MMNYFEITDDPSIQKRWHLEEPVFIGNKEALDFWPLISGERVDENVYKNISAPIQYEGRSLNFTLGAFLIPYVRKDIGEVIREFAAPDVKLLPCLVGEKDLGFCVLIVEKKIKCLDLKKSIVDYYTHEDLAEEEEENKDPGKIGKIKGVIKARVDTSKIAARDHIFRLEENLSYLIVSGALKEALQKKHISGVSFKRV